MTVSAFFFILGVWIYIIHLKHMVQSAVPSAAVLWQCVGGKEQKMIIIDYKDTRPIYEQIVDKFQTLILKGILEPNTRMPSVRSLAMELSINPNTIQKAYSELERQGFIYTVKGRGNFVSYDESLLHCRREELLRKLDALVEEAGEVGLTRNCLLHYLSKHEGERTEDDRCKKPE